MRTIIIPKWTDCLYEPVVREGKVKLASRDLNALWAQLGALNKALEARFNKIKPL